MTINKSEGRTLGRTILCLSHRGKGSTKNPSRRDLYVGITRVRRAEDLRLFLHGATCEDKWDSLDYIDHLKRNDAVRAYFAGFERQTNQANDPNVGWVSNKWNSHAAWMEYRRLKTYGYPD